MTHSAAQPPRCMELKGHSMPSRFYVIVQWAFHTILVDIAILHTTWYRRRCPYGVCIAFQCKCLNGRHTSSPCSLEEAIDSFLVGIPKLVSLLERGLLVWFAPILAKLGTSLQIRCRPQRTIVFLWHWSIGPSISYISSILWNGTSSFHSQMTQLKYWFCRWRAHTASVSL